ncbi:hypothetical protein C0584_05535 [Candidatus Parcubacteria bacterium]|nr:MAG: hypothetical protein C0584_05535 [Candidatus Parcubacteria bacterium]
MSSQGACLAKTVLESLGKGKIFSSQQEVFKELPRDHIVLIYQTGEEGLGGEIETAMGSVSTKDFCENFEELYKEARDGADGRPVLKLQQLS